MTVRDLFEEEEADGDETALTTTDDEEQHQGEDLIEYDEAGGLNVPNQAYINRLIKVGVPQVPIGDKAANLWVFSPDFLEQVVLNNLDGASQNKLWRRWVDIDSQSQGDGNAELVQSRQRAFALRVVSQRARSDLPDVGTRERMALVTSENRQRVTQNVTTNTSRQGGAASGFLARLFGK